MTTCDRVAERVALGEPLGEMGEHAATCERCKRLVALPVELGTTRRDADPGLGFSARMTAGAQHRIVVRRRRRIAAVAAAAVAATSLGVFAFTRDPSESPQLAETPASHDTPTPATNTHQPDPWDTQNPDQRDDVDDDVRALVQLANTDRSLHVSADWGHIGKPLAAYRTLLRGVSDE